MANEDMTTMIPSLGSTTFAKPSGMGGGMTPEEMGAWMTANPSLYGGTLVGDQYTPRGDSQVSDPYWMNAGSPKPTMIAGKIPFYGDPTAIGPHGTTNPNMTKQTLQPSKLNALLASAMGAPFGNLDDDQFNYMDSTTGGRLSDARTKISAILEGLGGGGQGGSNTLMGMPSPITRNVYTPGMAGANRQPNFLNRLMTSGQNRFQGFNPQSRLDRLRSLFSRTSPASGI